MIDLISKEEVKSKINDADVILNQCFDMLLDFKNARDNIGEVLLQFQPKLAKCLHELMLFYQKLKQENRKLVDEKPCYEKEIFAQIMNENQRYQEVVSETIKIGKRIGDAYAWFFYRNNRDELDKHFQHKSTGLFAAGVGGDGEVEFISNTSQIDGLYILYHGITDMLRIADFSLCDNMLGVVGTGEIKTQRIGNTLSITANIISKVNIAIQKEEKIKTVASTKGKENIGASFQKLEKQLKMQEDLLKPKLCERSLEQFASYEYNLINQLSKDCPMVINEDDSLLLYGTWSEMDNLFDVLFEKETMQEINEAFKDNAEKLIDSTSSFNEFILGEINTQMNCLRIPILWWNIKDEVCREIYFKKIGIVSIFNPAKLLERFVDEGFEVSNLGRLDKIVIEKNVGDEHWEFCHLESLCDLVCQSLMRTEDVFAFFRETQRAIEQDDIPSKTKVEMQIRLRNFGEPDKKNDSDNKKE